MTSIESDIDVKARDKPLGREGYSALERVVCTIAACTFTLCVILLTSIGILAWQYTKDCRKFTNSKNKDENVDHCDGTCRSLGCYAEAGYYMKIMNQWVNPCQDFYQFVCGNFIDEIVIDDKEIVKNAFSIAQTDVSIEIFSEIIERVRPSDLSAFKKIKIYYQNCMDQNKIETDGAKPLLEILEKIGGWPLLLGSNWTESNYDWRDTIYKIRGQKFVIFFPVISVAEIDNKNSSKNIIKIQSADTKISKTFLLDGPNNKLLKAYHDFMVDISVALGADREAATKEMKEVLDFEVDIFKIKTPPEDLMNMSDKDNNETTIKELSQKHPSIPWLKMLNAIFNPSGIYVNETEPVHVLDAEFIGRVEKLIKSTPKRVLANYLAWQVVQSTLMYMPSNLRKITLDFASTLEGTKETMNKESWCLNEMMEAFPISLSAMYLRKHFNKELKEQGGEILQNVKKQIKKNLQEVDWMDNETRNAALEKLDAMSATVGYVDELMDDKKVDEYYRELEINPGSYLESAFNITSFLEKENYKRLRNSVASNAWTLTRNVAVVNAYYILQMNAIEIPAGFLRSFYKPNRPHYINYGTIGTMIGHEIIHGFDNQGRKYDKKGNQNNWWQSGTEEKFSQKAKCLIDQYNNFTVKEVNLHVNGIATQGENIADNGGFKAAYYAYKEWAKSNRHAEPCLPFFSYSPRQWFWISAARNWCSKQRPEYLKDIISTDEHSPENARITISFSNIKEFAEDFNCKVGSKMNPEKKCVIW